MRHAALLRLTFAALLAAPACFESHEPEEQATEQVAAQEPPAVEQIVDDPGLGIDTLPAEDPIGADPPDPSAPAEEENPGGVDGTLPARDELPPDDYEGVGDESLPVAPDEQLVESIDDPDNAVPAL